MISYRLLLRLTDHSICLIDIFERSRFWILIFERTFYYHIGRFELVYFQKWHVGPFDGCIVNMVVLHELLVDQFSVDRLHRLR